VRQLGREAGSPRRGAGRPSCKGLGYRHLRGVMLRTLARVDLLVAYVRQLGREAGSPRRGVGKPSWEGLWSRGVMLRTLASVG
jgi:hypothetical protein